MIGRHLMGRSMAAGAIGMLSLTVAGLGVATAANGGSLILGEHNTAPTTTTLKDSKGTPLSLIGKKSRPPLRVSSSRQIKHLNASLLGGKSAGQLAVAGSAAQTGTNAAAPGKPLTSDSSAATLVARTGRLARGTYYVIASALLDATDGTGGGFCYVSPHSTYLDALQYGGATTTSYLQAAETVVARVKVSQTLGEYCYGMSTGVKEYNAGILAIRIVDSKSGSVPAVATVRTATVRQHGPGD